MSLDKNTLLSECGQQVMMSWEKPYMEASIDKLEPIGDVLEIGFGLGLSASRIMKYKPQSYTIIDCDPHIIQNIKQWREKYPQIPIHIIEGKWQDTLSTLGIFDEIYFDDYPLDINKESTPAEINISQSRLRFFLGQCIQAHTRVGTKISWYMSGNKPPHFPVDISNFTSIDYSTIPIHIPKECTYRDLKEQYCTIPLLTKTCEFNLESLLKNPFQKCA